MLRVPLVLGTFVTMTPVLVAVQWLLGRLGLPGRQAIALNYYRFLRRLLGLRIRVVGEKPPGPALIVSNHVSWCDIVVIGSLAPVAFVAKREVADWPLVGATARMQRTVFVDRDRRTQAAAANVQIAERLRDGIPVVLFAEGTSSDGNRVLPFRSALLGAVREALAQLDGQQSIAVQPLSIGYTRVQGIPMGRQHRPLAAWYGALDFVPHLKEFIRRGAFDVVVSWGTPLAYSGATDRKALMRMLEADVRSLTVAALRERPLVPPI